MCRRTALCSSKSKQNSARALRGSFEGVAVRDGACNCEVEMHRTGLRWMVVPVVLLLPAIPQAVAQGTLEDYQRAQRFLPGNLRHSIYVADIAAHWIDKTNRFWYHRVSPKGSEFVLVDADHNTSGPAVDHEKLAATLSSSAKKQFS